MTLEDFWEGIHEQGEEKVYYRYNRGVLPHLGYTNAIFAVTIRLIDSIPHNVLSAWKIELANILSARVLSDDVVLNSKIEYMMKMENYLDQGIGTCLLKDPRVASMVVNALKFYDQKDYRLLAGSVMPNHVHIILQLLKLGNVKYEMASIMRRIKSYTANKTNEILNRSGKVWMNEYFDRFIRSKSHLINSVKYVLNNPGKLGLPMDFTGCAFDEFRKELKRELNPEI